MKTEIVILSDPHIGMKSRWKLLPDGISIKTVDSIRRLFWMLSKIDPKTTPLVIFGGDFFDHLSVHTSLVIKSINIIKSLGKKKIGVIIIAGNHDNTANFKKKEQIDILSAIPNCLIFRGAASINFTVPKIYGYYGAKEITPKINSWWEKNIIPKLAQKGVGIALLPFLSVRGWADLYYKEWIEEETGAEFRGGVKRDDLNGFVANVLIPKMNEDLANCRNKILIGHYQLEGSRIHTGYNPEILPREMTFSKDMISPDLWDLVAFGHIHLPQPVWGHDKGPNDLWKIQQIGASDKLKFDERDDHRRYLVYDCDEKKLREVSIDFDPSSPHMYIRPMLQKEIDIPMGDPDPNRRVIEVVRNSFDPEILKRANLKIIVNIHHEDRLKYDKKKIREELDSDVFYIDHIVTNVIRSERKEDFKDVEKRRKIDLPELLDKFIAGLDLKEGKDFIPEVNAVAHDILEEAMRRYQR